MDKKCTGCAGSFPATAAFFRKNGTYSRCLSCERLAKREAYARNIEAERERRRTWRSANKETALRATRRWRAENNVAELARRRARYNANLDLSRLKKREWMRRNPGAVRASFRKKMASPAFRISRSLSFGIWRSLRSGKSGRHWESIVGFTLQELMVHLEAQFTPGMTFENYGRWHIDHRKPICEFAFESEHDEAFRQCWSLKNLRPLWAADNLKLGAAARVRKQATQRAL